MTCQLHVREGTVTSPLDRNPSTLQTRSSATLNLSIAIKELLEAAGSWFYLKMKELLEEASSWFYLKINLTKNLKVSQIKNWVRSKVLGYDVIVMEDATEKLGPSEWKPLSNDPQR
jgi:hypothetical protein